MKSIERGGAIFLMVSMILFGAGVSNTFSAEWTVPVKVLLDDAALTPLPLEWGVKNGATDLFDPELDIIAPLSTPDGDDAYFASIVNQEMPYNKLLKDLRGEGGGALNWRLVLRISPGKTIKVDWSEAKLPPGMNFGIQEADSQWIGVGPINDLRTGAKSLQWTNDTEQLRSQRLILYKH